MFVSRTKFKVSEIESVFILRALDKKLKVKDFQITSFYFQGFKIESVQTSCFLNDKLPIS